jgi:hypothetical protein
VPVIHWLRVEVTKRGHRRYEWRLLDWKGMSDTDSTEHYKANYDATEYTADCRGRGGTYCRQGVAELHAQDVRVAYEHRLGECWRPCSSSSGTNRRTLSGHSTCSRHGPRTRRTYEQPAPCRTRTTDPPHNLGSPRSGRSGAPPALAGGGPVRS